MARDDHYCRECMGRCELVSVAYEQGKADAQAQQPPAASERCDKCGHERRFSDNEAGICEKLTMSPSVDGSGMAYCGHRCVFPATNQSEHMYIVPTAGFTVETGGQVIEFFCHWLLRAYEAEARDTSYEQGETLRDIMRQVNQVLGWAGYEPESESRTALLKLDYNHHDTKDILCAANGTEQFRDLCLSALAIGKRNGEKTNWSAFVARLERAFADSPATGATSEHRAAAPAATAEESHDSCSHRREGDSDNCVWCGDDLGPTTEADVAPAPTAAPPMETRRCGFCGKTEHEVPTLIQAPVGFICNECVKICADIIKRNEPSATTPGNAAIDIARQIVIAWLREWCEPEQVEEQIDVRLVRRIAAALPPTAPAPAQTWCDHCSADLNDTQHILCERCYGEYAGPKWFDPAFIPEPIKLSARDFQRFLAALESEDEEPSEKLKALFKVEENKVETAPAGVVAAAKAIVKAWLWHTPEHDQERACAWIADYLTAHCATPTPAESGVVEEAPPRCKLVEETETE